MSKNPPLKVITFTISIQKLVLKFHEKIYGQILQKISNIKEKIRENVVFNMFPALFRLVASEQLQNALRSSWEAEWRQFHIDQSEVSVEFWRASERKQILTSSRKNSLCFMTSSKWPKNCEKQPIKPKILKVESIYNYTNSWKSASTNRSRHWKTKDLGVWHKASKSAEPAILQVSSAVYTRKITPTLHIFPIFTWCFRK